MLKWLTSLRDRANRRSDMRIVSMSARIVPATPRCFQWKEQAGSFCSQAKQLYVLVQQITSVLMK